MKSELEKYRECFDACGVKLPDGTRWNERRGLEIEEISDIHPDIWFLQRPNSALALCRVTAEDWLRRKECWTLRLLFDNPEFAGPNNAVEYEDVSDDAPTIRGEGPTIHAALRAALYRLAGKDVASD